ncbi:peptidoglycan/LPS O-acetylase OafA/YrhL [Rhodoblastus acidophilus]|uniref:acyltransferase family protein n=1 Tax=Rhodoblastus acidophilus TaxID=1074 RepID=UPI0022242988|nr:acyltransferase [Rhodoblastus acidophilus]MCW2285743.1 peptidoglycan/LPS O-acetylase OafA/YrhL [Rhodoblastus acidophilus]MCW2333115.1 peptidoglycan/LPS O-acetylase OafA/YrhL [Rhodoblastus acidophilus]
MAISSPKWSYSPALDQLRFVAATVVLFYHFKPFNDIPANATGLRYIGDLWLAHGGVGVSLFIVLTGFLFSMIFDAGRLPVNYGRFIVKRAFRILPMYLVVMFLLMAQIRPSWTAETFLKFALFQVNTGDPITGFGNQFLPVGPIWTIGVEFQFYLLFPLLIAAIPAYDWRRIGGLVLVTVLFRLLLGFWTPSIYDNLYHTMLGRLDQFLIGMAGAAAFCAIRHRISKPIGFAVAACAVGLLTAWIAVFDPSKYPLNMFGFTVEALLFAAMIVGFHAAGGVPGAIGRGLATLGSASYSLYLLHLFVGMVLFKAVDQWGLHMSNFVRALLFAFLPSLGLSLLTYFVIEKPFIALGKRLGPNSPTEAPT